MRSLRRGFLGMFGCFKAVLRQELSSRTQLHAWNIKTRERPCVKAKQTIVKSCNEIGELVWNKADTVGRV